MNVAIVLEDKFNDENIIFIKTFKPQRVYYFVTIANSKDGYYEKFASYMRSEFRQIEIKVKFVDDLSPGKLYQLINTIDNVDGICLSSSNSLLSVLMSKIANNKRIDSYFIDIQKNRIIKMDRDSFEEMPVSNEYIKVKEFIDISGGEVVNKTSSSNKDYNVKLIVDYIVNNQESWKKIKSIIARGDVFIHNQEDKTLVEVLIEKLNREDYLVFKSMISFLKRVNHLKTYMDRDSHLIMKFKSLEYKNMIFVTGKWLESYTYICVKSIEGVSDVESGLTFNWGDATTSVNNEIDVLATFNYKLYCISCKDTSNYDVDALNELQVNAYKIGGDKVGTILVSTEKPRREIILKRAEEMGIKIVIFDGNQEAFARNLTSAFV